MAKKFFRTQDSVQLLLLGFHLIRIHITDQCNFTYCYTESPVQLSHKSPAISQAVIKTKELTYMNALHPVWLVLLLWFGLPAHLQMMLASSFSKEYGQITAYSLYYQFDAIAIINTVFNSLTCAISCLDFDWSPQKRQYSFLWRKQLRDYACIKRKKKLFLVPYDHIIFNVTSFWEHDKHEAFTTHKCNKGFLNKL